MIIVIRHVKFTVLNNIFFWLLASYCLFPRAYQFR